MIQLCCAKFSSDTSGTALWGGAMWWWWGGGVWNKKMWLQIKGHEIKTCPSPLGHGRVPLPVPVGLPVRDQSVMEAKQKQQQLKTKQNKTKSFPAQK